MKVKMLDSFSGPDTELLYGEIYDLPTDEAMRMIGHGGAVKADEEEVELNETIKKAKTRLEEKTEEAKMKDAPKKAKKKAKKK